MLLVLKANVEALCATNTIKLGVTMLVRHVQNVASAYSTWYSSYVHFKQLAKLRWKDFVISPNTVYPVASAMLRDISHKIFQVICCELFRSM